MLNPSSPNRIVALLPLPLFLLLLLLPLGLAPAPGAAAEEGEAGAVSLRQQIETLLGEQAAAWTAGDLEAFCSAYAEDVVFVSPTGLTSGRQQVLERYRRRYPDKAAMGALTLEVEEVRVAGPEAQAWAASAVARWKLSYAEKEPAEGLTLLVFHRDGDGAWKIVQDASM